MEYSINHNIPYNRLSKAGYEMGTFHTYCAVVPLFVQFPVTSRKLTKDNDAMVVVINSKQSKVC